MSTERLWAPWRMEFIRTVDEEDGCFLCRAAETDDDRARFVVHRGETCFCLLNVYPYNNAHLLIAPYRHEGDLEALTEAERNEVMALCTQTKQVMDRTVNPHGYNIGVNLGRAAGAGLAEHFHMHVVPRWSGDVNFMTTVGSTKVIPQALEETWALLREEWDRADS